MTKFKEYLLESAFVIPEEAMYYIRKNCKKYLNLVKGRSIYRKTDLDFATEIVRGVLWKNSRPSLRKSKGMNENVSRYINRFLKQHNHVDRRKSICVSSDLLYLEEAEFGYDTSDNYIFFPIGNFNYSWIEGKDINLMSDSKHPTIRLEMSWVADHIFRPNKINYYENDLTPEFASLSHEERIKDFEKRLSKIIHTNEGLGKAITNGFEIWFDCETYYLLKF